MLIYAICQPTSKFLKWFWHLWQTQNVNEYPKGFCKTKFYIQSSEGQMVLRKDYHNVFKYLYASKMKK